MTNTSKQVENQHLMGLFLEKETGNKEQNSRRKTEREKTVLTNPELCLLKWFVQVHFFGMLN